jgi:hypothetical protein
MRTRGSSQVLPWAVLGIVLVSSALGVLAAAVSGPLAVAVVLGGVIVAGLLSYAAQPAAGPGEQAVEPSRDEYREAA